MATKTKQIGVRLEPHQLTVLDEIKAKYNHTAAGVVSLAVDQLIHAYEKSGGVLPGLPVVGQKNVAAPEAAGARR